MGNQQEVYLSYLLRLWSTSDCDEQVWRASLQSGTANQRQGFGSLDDLFRFLRQETEMFADQMRARSDEVGGVALAMGQDREP